MTFHTLSYGHKKPNRTRPQIYVVLLLRLFFMRTWLFPHTNMFHEQQTLFHLRVQRLLHSTEGNFDRSNLEYMCELMHLLIFKKSFKEFWSHYETCATGLACHKRDSQMLVCLFLSRIQCDQPGSELCRLLELHFFFSNLSINHCVLVHILYHTVSFHILSKERFAHALQSRYHLVTTCLFQF